jgi:hypothetical protein
LSWGTDPGSVSGAPTPQQDPTADDQASLSVRPALGMLTDRPIEDDAADRLGFGAYADALTELLDHPETDTPLTIAISAPWGAGKTSLARMVERRLLTWPAQRGEPSHITCWFNAWIHDDAPNLSSAFAAHVARTANRHRRYWRRFLNPLSSAMLTSQERWRRYLIVGGAGLAITAALALALTRGPGGALTPESDLLKATSTAFGLGSLRLAIVVSGMLAIWTKLFSVAQTAASFVRNPESEAAKGSMFEVRAQLGELIEQATHGRRRFVIFVDDLERCQPSRALQVCEVASQLLSHQDVAIVLVADMTVIARSAQSRYGLGPSSGSEANSEQETSPQPLEDYYGRLYLKKIVQIEFGLPPLPGQTMQEIVRTSAGAADADNDRRLGPGQGGSGGFLSGSSKDQTRFPGAIKRRLASAWHRPWRTLLWAAGGIVGFLLGASVLIVVMDALIGGPPIQDTWVSVEGAIIGAAFILWSIGLVVGLISSIVRGVRRVTARRASREIDAAIREEGPPTESDVSELQSKMLDSTAAKRSNPELVYQRMQRYLTGTILRKEAEDETLRFLPPLPRSAKRVLNRLRVLLVVAVGRRMLGGDPYLAPRHLGKWTILLERWPQLGEVLVSDPLRAQETMVKLESAMTAAELSQTLASMGLRTESGDELFRFLSEGAVMSPVVERLIYCTPVETRQGSGTPVESGSASLQATPPVQEAPAQ